MQNAMAAEMKRKISPKSAVSMLLRSIPMHSFLLEGFQTTYEGIMVARGHLAAMLHGRHDKRLLNMTTKLMELNHKLDETIQKSEDILEDYLSTRD